MSSTHWLPESTKGENLPNALCLGTGRFLRSVLVPTLVGAGLRPALIQTRGRSFLEMMASSSTSSSGSRAYPVDTVLPSGDVQTDQVACWGAFSLGKLEDKSYVLDNFLPTLNGISILGIGVTEAGLVSKDTQVMKDLFLLFQRFQQLVVQDKKWDLDGNKICVIDMDNVPNNGDKVRQYMLELAARNSEMTSFLEDHVVFMNSMVDRITSHREGDTMVPKCEPMPAKALVVLDPNGDLPPPIGQQPGVVVRQSVDALELDIALKLRVANGTHTAIAHLLALMKLLKTDVLSSDEPGTLMMKYLDSLVESQIVPSAGANQGEATAVYKDWRQRLVHPHFGLSSFFITQNGPAKGGIRWGPTVKELISQKIKLEYSMAFAYAVMLRWLTPVPNTEVDSEICIGWLDGVDSNQVTIDKSKGEEYADGLLYDLKNGWYQYKCSISSNETKLTALLQKCVTAESVNDCMDAVKMYLLAPDGGDLSSLQDSINDLMGVVSQLYLRLISGESVGVILEELGSMSNGVGFNNSCDYNER